MGKRKARNKNKHKKVNKREDKKNKNVKVEENKNEKIEEKQDKRNKKKHKFQTLDEKDFIALEKQLNPQELELRKVIGDGNCLFRSVADQLEDDENLYPAYRQHVCDYIEKNREHFEPFIVDESFEDYIANMREDKTWGGNLELQAISMAYRVNIVVHQLDMPKYQIVNFPNAKTIHLSYHLGEHYNSVRPKSSSVLKFHDPTAHVTSESNKKIKIIMESTQCDDAEYVRKVLQEHMGDMDAAIEYLVMEKQNFGKFNTQEDVNLEELIGRVIEVSGCCDIDLVTTLLIQNNHDANKTIEQILSGEYNLDIPKKETPKKSKKLSRKEKAELKKKQKEERTQRSLSKKERERRAQLEKAKEEERKNRKILNDEEEIDEEELMKILEKTQAIRI